VPRRHVPETVTLYIVVAVGMVVMVVVVMEEEEEEEEFVRSIALLADIREPALNPFFVTIFHDFHETIIHSPHLFPSLYEIAGSPGGPMELEDPCCCEIDRRRHSSYLHG